MGKCLKCKHETLYPIASKYCFYCCNYSKFEPKDEEKDKDNSNSAKQGGESMTEFTDREKAILKVMFRNMKNIIEICGGSIDIDYDSFTRNDLYALFLKLGIGDYYEYDAWQPLPQPYEKSSA